MPLSLANLKLYGSATMPDDDTPTNIGGAIATTKKISFRDVSGLIQLLSSTSVDTTQSVTVHYRDGSGTLLNEAKTLNGVTPVAYVASPERLLKAIKSATTVGDVAVEAQTAERTGTAQGGSADTITLDVGASAVNDFYNQFVVRITSGLGVGQIREIVGYNGSTKVATVNDPWGIVPNSTSVFRISRGFFFDRRPNELFEVRRPFYNASANPPGGGAVAYHEKGFFQNSSTGGLSLLTAKVVESADPSGKVTFGLAPTINDTGGNGGGNNRKVAPAGITFDNADKTVPGTDLLGGSSIGVWLKLSLLDGDVALKTDYTLQLAGSSV